MKKVRIDRLLVEKGLVSSREKAQALIMAGCVFIGDTEISKPGHAVADDVEIRIKGEDHPYVSRGGVKLAHALENFKIDVRDLVCLDVGASTGGFTDCLLQSGAKKVYAVDVGYGQLAMKLQNDPRVVIIDRQNIRFIQSDQLPDQIDIIVIDVSFISLELIFPSVISFLKDGGLVVALIKPQFEVGRELVGKGGIVKDNSAHKLAVEKVLKSAEANGLVHIDTIDSPIEGTKGNKEFLAFFKK